MKEFIGVIALVVVAFGPYVLGGTILFYFLAWITGAFKEQCDCVTRVDHYAAGMTGRAGVSYIADRACPKCDGTGIVNPKSPFADQPSPVLARSLDRGAVAAVAASSGSSICRMVEDDRLARQRDEDEYISRQSDDDLRSRSWDHYEESRRMND